MESLPVHRFIRKSNSFSASRFSQDSQDRERFVPAGREEGCRGGLAESPRPPNREVEGKRHQVGWATKPRSPDLVTPQAKGRSIGPKIAFAPCQLEQIMTLAGCNRSATSRLGIDDIRNNQVNNMAERGNRDHCASMIQAKTHGDARKRGRHANIGQQGSSRFRSSGGTLVQARVLWPWRP